MALDDIHGYCSKCNKRFIINPRTFSSREKCHNCGGSIIWSNLTVEEWFLIDRTSKDPDFLQMMMELKNSNVVEFQNRIRKMYHQSVAAGDYRNSQTTLSYINPYITQSKPPAPTCPKCGSTYITTGARGVSGFWGFIGANKTVNRCANCGYTWKPRG